MQGGSWGCGGHRSYLKYARRCLGLWGTSQLFEVCKEVVGAVGDIAVI